MECIQRSWAAISLQLQKFARNGGWSSRFVVFPAIGLVLAACAESPERIASIDVFRDTRRIETELKKGYSTTEDIRRILGEPTGSGSVFMASVQQRPLDMWFYQDIELTGIKSSKGQIDLEMRQQILLVFLRDGTYEGFMWFSNADAATAWVKDSLRGKVGR